MAATDKDKYVTELRASDVLFGRGSGPNDHEGNVQFRSYVSERKEEYMATNHRMTKAKIAKEIVDKVFAANGRFLKKVEPTELKSLGMPEGTDVWEVVGDDTIMEKAKQALRQNTQKAKSSSASDTDSKQSPQPNKQLERSSSEGRHRHSHIPPITSSSRMGPSVVTLGEFDPLPISPASYGSGEPPDFSPLASQATRMAAAPGTNFAPWGGHVSGMNNRMAQISQMHLHYHQHPQMHEMMMHSRQHQARDESMLSYVRRSHQNHHLHQLHAYNEVTPQPSLDASNLSMAQIPHDDLVGPTPVRLSELGRQGSMNMADLAKSSQGGEGPPQQQHQQHRRPVMEMDELMDSFSKMKTGGGGGGAAGDETKKMHASVETMGTIEHINPGSIADMSLGTMGSSTFSLFRGNESLAAMDDKLLDHQNHPPTPDNLREGGFNDPGSMSLSDVWGTRRKSSGTTTSGVTMTGSLISQSNSSSTTSKEFARDNRSLRDSLAYQPKPINKLTESEVSGLDVEQMGSSSLSVLKAAYTINNEDENRHIPQKTFYVGDHAPSKEK